VGLRALAAMQQQETLLSKISEALNAPVEKLDKTAEKVVKELKEAQLEKRHLLKELAEKESIATQTQSTETATEVEGISIVKRDFEGVIDANRMLTTATEVIKRNDATVTVYYGSDGKTCRLLIMAGETAIKKGINAGNIVKEASPIFGGGGGGRPNFAQGGGTQCDKIKEAVAIAEEVIKRQLST